MKVVVLLLFVVLMALASCAPIPAALPTPAGVTSTDAPPAAEPVVTSTLPPGTATGEPAVMPTETVPTAPTVTLEGTPTPPAATTVTPNGASAEPTVAPGFATYRDPAAGFAIDYPENWPAVAPPLESRAAAQAYTASIRSDPQSSSQPGGEPLPPGETGIDVTVVRTRATSVEEALAERRAEILSSELGVTVTEEFEVELTGGLRAVRRQLETAQAGTVAELTTYLNGNRVMVHGMGNLDPFDLIARSLRPIAQGGSGVSPAVPVTTPGAEATYTEPELGFAFALPAEWRLCQDSGVSRLFCRRETTGGPAFPVFYVTLLAPGFTNEDAAAYNFISEEDVAALAALGVGQSYATEALPEYSTFTRLPDAVVDERPAVVVENVKVWEGGPDTKDRRAFVKTDTGTYMLGTYYRTAEELAEFERVLGSVTITAR